MVTATTASILVVDDEESIRFTFKTFLEREGYRVLCADSFSKAVDYAVSEPLDLIFADIILGGKTGIEFLADVKRRGIATPVIIVTGEPSVETAAEAVRQGAFDYLSKPIRKEQLLKAASLGISHYALANERERYRSHLEAIFRSVQDGILTVDKNFEITHANEALGIVCGLPAQEIVGKKLRDVFPPRYSEPFWEILQTSFEKRQPLKQQYDITATEGRQQTLVLSGAPLLHKNGALLGTLLVARDITRLAHLERELQERQSFHNIIGSDTSMQHIFELIEDLADYDTTVLITGESGTGKERIAEALHYQGARAKKAFVKVNCSALAENLLESELFGHVKGSFTGAVKDKIGRFSMANGGTLFLDEIGDISARIQLKLLRVLQEKEIERVGASHTEKIDVRVIAATNKDLRDLVRKGEFREDLYYRLKVIEIPLPPLRQRRGDIPLLCTHFIERFNKKFKKSIAGLAPDAEHFFMHYPWPGNIRELEHTLEHAFVICRDPLIQLKHVPLDMRSTETLPISHRVAPMHYVDDKESIIKVLDKVDWNKAKAARLLGISRKTMYRRLERFNIEDPEVGGGDEE